MARVTKAELQKQLAAYRQSVLEARKELSEAERDEELAQTLAVQKSIELENLKDLYTRVRIAIGGGTGQEPWDIFKKIQGIKDDVAHYERRAEYWRTEWRAEHQAHTKTLIKSQQTWWDRTKPRLAAWWKSPKAEEACAWFMAVAILAVGFGLGWASAQ